MACGLSQCWPHRSWPNRAHPCRHDRHTRACCSLDGNRRRWRKKPPRLWPGNTTSPQSIPLPNLYSTTRTWTPLSSLQPRTRTQPIIQAAAAAGKHIFCEKPLALDLNDIDAAVAAADRAGVKLQVGFNRRFDANFARVRNAVISGEIGAPHLLHIISRDPAPPSLEYVRVSGGLFRDMMIHDFDMARFLMGCEATEIYATGAVLVDREIGKAGDIDTALVSLTFENGALGVIDNSRQAVYGYDQRIDLLGSKGGIRVENNHPNSVTVSTAESVRRDLPLHFFLERYAESYVVELTAFVDAILSDSEVPVTGYDGKMPVVMALAAAKSLSEHRPVTLNEIMRS